MLSLIKDNRDALQALCRRSRVVRLDLFGSAADGGFDAGVSDLDFLVEFQDMTPEDFADAYFSLLEGLERLFGRAVDLVTESAITNPYFRESVDRTRTSVYAV